MLKITVPTTKRVPVEIYNFQWEKPSTILEKQPCKLCKQHIGKDRWGLAWIIQGEKKFSGRLCQKCGEEAEQSFAPDETRGTHDTE